MFSLNFKKYMLLLQARRIKMKSGKCPKCSSKNIIKIKDILHANGGGNITQSRHLFTDNKCAKVTFYICENCGFVENYLDEDEIKKLK